MLPKRRLLDRMQISCIFISPNPIQILPLGPLQLWSWVFWPWVSPNFVGPRRRQRWLLRSILAAPIGTGGTTNAGQQYCKERTGNMHVWSTLAWEDNRYNAEGRWGAIRDRGSQKALLLSVHTGVLYFSLDCGILLPDGWIPLYFKPAGTAAERM